MSTRKIPIFADMVEKTPPMELSTEMIGARSRNGWADSNKQIPRPGSMDAYKLPSRIGEKLSYLSKHVQDG